MNYQWPLVLKGGRDFADSFTYQVIDDTGLISNLGEVKISIAERIDGPSAPAVETFEGMEDQTLEFTLSPFSDADLIENLSYEFVGTIDEMDKEFSKIKVFFVVV